MDNILGYAVYICVSVTVCFLVSFLYMRYERKRIERQTIKMTLKIYGERLSRISEYIEKVCPTCAFHNSKQCEKVDVNNLIVYGKCTNFEQKRF